MVNLFMFTAVLSNPVLHEGMEVWIGFRLSSNHFFFFLDKDIRQTKSNIEEERVIMYIINTPKTPWKENLHLNI